VKTTLLHARETQAVQPGAAPVELELAVATPPARRPGPSALGGSPG
jgi:hypothetical protein